MNDDELREGIQQPVPPKPPPQAPQADDLPRLGRVRRRDSGDELPRLGSLAQSARAKELNTARNMMFLVAAILVLSSIVELVTLRDQARQVMRQNPGQFAANANLQQVEDLIVFFGSIFAGGIMVLAAVFVVFGFLVKRFPVPITIIGLSLYLLFNLVLAALNPMTILSGILFKIIIIVGLAKAIQSALAYQKALRLETLGDDYD